MQRGSEMFMMKTLAKPGTYNYKLLCFLSIEDQRNGRINQFLHFEICQDQRVRYKNYLMIKGMNLVLYVQLDHMSRTPPSDKAHPSLLVEEGPSSPGLVKDDKTAHRIICSSLNRSIYSAICTDPLIETLYSMYTKKSMLWCLQRPWKRRRSQPEKLEPGSVTDPGPV